jgi:hypothetical protein
MQTVTALELLSKSREVDWFMAVAAGLAVLVVFCLLLSMVQSPPAVGR